MDIVWEENDKMSSILNGSFWFCEQDGGDLNWLLVVIVKSGWIPYILGKYDW
jgi:hypothetical protein